MDDTAATPIPAPRRIGVFTPSASVLCIACDSEAQTEALRRAYPNRSYPADLTTLVAQGEGAGPAECDTCHAPVWVREDVATLQEVLAAAYALDPDGPWSAELRQTGGMNVALVAITDDERQIVATSHDQPMFLGEYLDEDWADATRTHEWETGYVGETTVMVGEVAAMIVAWARAPHR